MRSHMTAKETQKEQKQSHGSLSAILRAENHMFL